MGPGTDAGLKWTGISMLFKCVHVAAGPAEAGPAEAGGLLASSLPLLDHAHRGQSQAQINPVGLDAGRVAFIS